jgi:pyruvate dehydrogenase E2 component (dihydrolipoamide acetyltransferase)
MPINILMPALSPTMEKGNLSKWLKREGEKVKPGDLIAEIETDKATMEVEAVDEGTLARIVVAEGTADVPVNQVIAVLAGEGEDVKAAAAGAERATATPTPKVTGVGASHPAPSAPPSHKGGGINAPVAQSRPSSRSGESGAAQAAPGGVLAARTDGSSRAFGSPLARRLAKEAGIDISRIQGSGPHGRVIARDIDAAKSGKSLRAAPMAATGSAIAPSMSDRQIRALYEDGSYELVPHDGMRRTIAQRLTASTQTVPHFYLTIDCDIGMLMAAREEINTTAPKDKDGKPAYKVSVNDFVIKALALALQRVPDANVSWTESGMLKHKHSDVGVAVALPGGLITPIVRHAESKSLSAISSEMKDLAARARARKLKPQEFQGGVTSVSNLGMYGVKDFTAVINPPQSTILAVGAGEERVVVKSGKIEVAQIMSVTLSCDHRAVDGALGAELIGAFKALIENPVMMVV